MRLGWGGSQEKQVFSPAHFTTQRMRKMFPKQTPPLGRKSISQPEENGQFQADTEPRLPLSPHPFHPLPESHPLLRVLICTSNPTSRNSQIHPQTPFPVGHTSPEEERFLGSTFKDSSPQTLPEL